MITEVTLTPTPNPNPNPNPYLNPAGDQDTGDREQTLLMKWDAIAMLLHVILGLLDLCFRMEISVVQVRYLVITPIACPVLPHGDLGGAGYSLHYHAVAVSITYGCSLDYIWLQAVLDPTREELLFETFICTTLSLLAAPFVLWKIPVVGELIHQARPT